MNWTDPFVGTLPGLSHFLSLAVEEQFYLLWLLVVALADSPPRPVLADRLGHRQRRLGARGPVNAIATTPVRPPRCGVRPTVMPGFLHDRALALLIAGIGVGLGADLRAQDAASGLLARPIAESVERVARELWPTGALGQVDDNGQPRFRASITAHLPPLPAPWYDAAPEPFQQRGTLYHREFLSTVTPEAFRGSAVRPIAGVSVDPGTMFDPAKRAWREWQTRRVHARIQRELEALCVSGVAEAYRTTACAADSTSSPSPSSRLR